MNVNEKIRTIREIRNWSQEDMAEKMNMSKNGYAKIERGETKLNLHKLEQIANIFNIDVLELIKNDDKNVLFFMNDHNANYYGSNENLTSEIDRLKLTISHKDELLKQRDLVIEQKDSEISALKEIISLLKSK
ncbi:XRE family transcriptional regulator [Aggregatibacter aphrophilus]|jgi:helix-turn-helix domain-containing protein|uniref:helix-turn-helix domain-containing protein n=1 Tax=Aggregatibacter kilianii TaxID=2025884 RepID=UPI000DAD090F|nr:helix-turn-helix transcriptional regulator [Aggregatibacter kilianii]RDF02213.1 XRE family transcriptional regulator [Aggregatibacter aphrophilus]DAN48929.1 MAG TPA: helix-turn-helix domain protein [Caudoviricetes sp.]